MLGKVHSFQSLGTVDGPGIRCVVFMQGCPLRCICCHNPDTWSMDDGTWVEAEALAQKISRFRPYFRQNGGVTVSGGEPLLQTEFVTELFLRCKRQGISTALDTSGFRLDAEVKELLKVTDLVLLDHKYAKEPDYYQNTRSHLAQVQSFLSYLEEQQIPTWLRRVIIPGINDDDESTRALFEVARKHSCVKKTELLPFRKLCLEKYEQMKIPFPLQKVPEPTEEQMRHLNALENIKE